MRLPQQGESEEDCITHTFFTPNFKCPAAESDEANYVVFSSIPGTAPIIPSPGREPKKVSNAQATKPKVSSLFSQLDWHTERRHLLLRCFTTGTETYSSQQVFRFDFLRTKIQDQAIDQMVKNRDGSYGYLHAEECPEKWACRFCQETVPASLNDIYSHLRTHQLPEQHSSFLHRCDWPDCGYKTFQGKNFRSHEFVHRGVPQTLLRCNRLIINKDGSFRSCLFRCSGKSKMTQHKRGSDPHSPHACEENRLINSATHPSPASTLQAIALESEDTHMWTTSCSDGVSTAGEHSDVHKVMSDGESIMGVGGSETASSCSYTSCDDQEPMEDSRDQDGNERGTELGYAGEDDEGAREQKIGSTADHSNANTNRQRGYFTDYAGVRYHGYRYPPVVNYYDIGMRYPSYPTFGYPYGYVHHVGYIPVSYNPTSQAFSGTGLPHDEKLYQQTIDVAPEAMQDVLSSSEVSNDSDCEEASSLNLGRKGYLSWDELLHAPA
ncbi:hypothetical protein EIP86_002451 [Pleurotus ostreatoroseus]|nr:hypothetical protein EIP86_002451 [Pleurotus ostreatoroseus]